jgi:hypothetical protein
MGLLRNRDGSEHWQHIAYENDRRIKLVDYESLPESTKDKLPTLEEIDTLLSAKEQSNKKKSIDQHISNHIVQSDFNYFNRRLHNLQKSTDMSFAAAVLRFLVKYNLKKQLNLIGYNCKSDLRSDTLAYLKKDVQQNGRHRYGFHVSNIRVLQNKELAFKKAFQTAFENASNSIETDRNEAANQAALDTLLHNGLGNANRMIIGKPSGYPEDDLYIPGTRINLAEFHARKLFFLYTNPGKANKYDFEEIYRRYLKICEGERQTPVDISTVKKFLTRQEVRLYAEGERNGFKAIDKMVPHMKRSRPAYSLSKGGYDGFQVDFYSKKEGKQIMLTVVAVFDYHSGAITGYDIGVVEDGLMVRNMYRNHLNTTGGLSYMEIESDRFSGNLTADTRAIFEQTCNKITQPAPNDRYYKGAANPKARYVERLIQELNRMTQSMPGWKGTNITSIDSQRKPNYEYLKGDVMMEHDQAVQAIIQLVNAYNHTPIKKFSGRTRMQEFKASMNPEAPKTEPYHMAMLLNKSTVTTVRNGVVAFEVNRRKYEYQFTSYVDFAAYLMPKMKVKVYYDETDMSTVDLFGRNERYLATIGTLNRFNEALAEQTEDDKKQWGKQRSWRAKTLDAINRKSLEALAAELGVDIGGRSIEDARAIVMGAAAQRDDSFETRHHEALETMEAQQSQAYYEDRLLRGKGIAVPAPRESNEDKRREYYRNRNSNG